MGVFLLTIPAYRRDWGGGGLLSARPHVVGFLYNEPPRIRFGDAFCFIAITNKLGRGCRIVKSFGRFASVRVHPRPENAMSQRLRWIRVRRLRVFVVATMRWMVDLRHAPEAPALVKAEGDEAVADE